MCVSISADPSLPVPPLSFDIALLRLSKDAVLNPYVLLGNLPTPDEVLPHEHPCYITGWGLTASECPSHLLPSTRHSHRIHSAIHRHSHTLSMSNLSNTNTKA